VSAQQTYESGLQSECVYLLSALAKELEDVTLSLPLHALS
jgi:hypothetical protein